MSRVHEIKRSPTKKMRYLPKDVPQIAQRGMMPWQITEYRQVYCLDRLPDCQLPDAVSLIAISPPPGDYVWVISCEQGINVVQLGVVKEILHYQDSTEQNIVTEILRHIPIPLALGEGNRPIYNRIYPTRHEVICDMTQGQVHCAGFESYREPLVKRVPRSKMELVTNVNEGASWVEVQYIRKDLWAKRLKVQGPHYAGNELASTPTMAETAIPHSPVIVHHLSNSRSQQELEIPYEIRKWDCTPEIAAPAELRQIHPLGGSPIIEDGDLVLAESGAIIEYPIAKYGNGRFSPSEAGWTDNLYCMSIFPRVQLNLLKKYPNSLTDTYYAGGTLMPYLVNLLAFSIVPDRAPLIVRHILRMAFNGLISQMIVPSKGANRLKSTLRRRLVDFFAAGETIKSTDFQMVFALEMWLGGGPELSPVGEHAHKFVETVHASTSMAEAKYLVNAVDIPLITTFDFLSYTTQWENPRTHTVDRTYPHPIIYTPSGRCLSCLTAAYTTEIWPYATSSYRPSRPDLLIPGAEPGLRRTHKLFSTSTMAEPTTAHSTIIVHHLNNSRSQRILWLLVGFEELKIPYEIRKWDRTPEMVAPAELRQIHPLGGSPIIEDGDLVLAESGYLITKYGKGRFNPSEAGWTNNLYYTHYAEGTLMPYLVNLLVFSIVPDRAPLLVRPILRMIEEHLEKKPGRFFAGGENLTSADFQMVFPLEAWLSRGSDLAPLGENTRTFVETIHARLVPQVVIPSMFLTIASVFLLTTGQLING
ncbi:hypothetical protein AG1IA_00766 [Rhizoctonia solani AG-1 IA]|uniref:GST N-terminal domain-containing protein n=1 Tax=Thanatephorus cucumeris (strain AG1-IA) TaxID=983506 RepID=L8X961_THACA|nr:hypothetical protein AG1IA_00766 [Rhizoctonia solani AG-1 IA]